MKVQNDFLGLEAIICNASIVIDMEQNVYTFVSEDHIA